MLENKDHQSATKEVGLIKYCDQLIIAFLYIIVIAVPLFFGVNLHSIFDLSKITILYILIFAIMAIWSIRILAMGYKNNRQPFNEHGGVKNINTGSLAKALGCDKAPFRLAHPLNLPILAFLLVSGLATVFSVHPYLSLAGTYKRYGGFLSTIVYICLFYVVVNFIEKKRLNSFLNVIILTACVASIVGLLQQSGLDPFKWNVPDVHSELYRIFSTFGHPAFFSAFLIMVIPLVLTKIFSHPSAADQDQHYIHVLKPYSYICILALLMIALCYTRTRASFLGLIVSSLFFFSLVGKKNLLTNKTKTIFTLAVLIGISTFFNLNDKTSTTRRFFKDFQPALLDNKQNEMAKTMQNKNLTGQELFSPSGFEEKDHGFAYKLEDTAFMRVIQYTTGFWIICDYPVLGIGPETLGMIYPQYVGKAYKGMKVYKHFRNQNRIHNDFLDVAVSRGLLGLGVYLWLLFIYFRMVWKGYKRAEGLDKILIIGLCSGCLGYFIQNQFSFGHIPIITLLWFLIGFSVIVNPVKYSPSNGDCNLPVLTGQRVRNRAIEWYIKYSNFRFLRSRRPGNCFLLTTTIITVCLMALLMTLSMIRYRADIYFDHGRVLLKRGSIMEGIKSYEMAVKYNPLEINYRNVLNGLYLKMVLTGLNVNKNRADKEGLPDYFSREQTAVWFTKAISGAEKVQRLYPGDYRSAFLLGQAYHVLENVSNNKDLGKEVLKYYQKVKLLHPFKYELRFKLAQFYAENGNYREAIDELNEALRIMPNRSKAILNYINLAEIFVKQKRYEDARKLFNRVTELSLSPNNKDGQYARKMLETLPISSRVK